MTKSRTFLELLGSNQEMRMPVTWHFISQLRSLQSSYLALDLRKEIDLTLALAFLLGCFGLGISPNQCGHFLIYQLSSSHMDPYNKRGLFKVKHLLLKILMPWISARFTSDEYVKNVLVVVNTRPPRGLDPALSLWCTLPVCIFINIWDQSRLV